jgi:hexosaminidase
MTAQLWGEVVRAFSQVEWQIYPKIYGLAERAWNNRSNLKLSEYNHLVYDNFLPQLAASGRNFHIQQPGIKVIDGTIKMNKVMQGGEILYCLEDGEWRTYTSPIEVLEGTQIVKAKVCYLGKESNTTWLWINAQIETDTHIQEQNTGATF